MRIPLRSVNTEKKKRKDIKLGKTIKQAKNHRTQKNLTNSSVLPYE